MINSQSATPTGRATADDAFNVGSVTLNSEVITRSIAKRRARLHRKPDLTAGNLKRAPVDQPFKSGRFRAKADLGSGLGGMHRGAFDS
jgi:hypothetical protein